MILENRPRYNFRTEAVFGEILPTFSQPTSNRMFITLKYMLIDFHSLMKNSYNFDVSIFNSIKYDVIFNRQTTISPPYFITRPA